MTDAYRFDVMSGDWVAVVPGRKKAHAMRRGRVELPSPEGPCPFCPGNEAETEATVAAFPETGPWQVRVVNNLFPLASALAAVGDSTEDPGSPLERLAVGVHEVLVEHPGHDLDLPDYTDEHLRAVLGVYRDRARALATLPGAQTVAVFRNRGRRAGSSQPHPHGQIVATPVPAPRAVRRQALAAAHFAEHGVTLLETQMADERAAGRRVVLDHGTALAFVPFAPRQNHHVRIAAAGASGMFGDASDDQVAHVAALVGPVLRRLRAATGGVPYNILFESPPVADRDDPASFWFLDVLPRRGGPAGFEHSTGIHVIIEDPDASAAMLREPPDASRD